jgi:hypothetical protein
MDVEEFRLTCPAIDDSLACCFKRYRPVGSATVGDANSIAIIFAHAVSTRGFPAASLLIEETNDDIDKETWEPCITRLFQVQLEASATTGVRIGEVWSSDSPNHGQAAVLNEETLLKRPQGICMSTAQ